MPTAVGAVMTESVVDLLVIGAGMAGLTAARLVREQGRTVQVVDKGRGFGGRMATRRMAGGRLDHGAQFFTVNTPEFEAMVRTWEDAGVAMTWCRGFRPAQDGRWCWRGAGGMTDIAKFLARDLDVVRGRRIVKLVMEADHWRAESEDGAVLRGRSLLTTAPIPQALDIFAASEIALPEDVDQALRRLDYEPSFALLAALDGPSGIPAPGGVKLETGPLAWIADNQQKGISETETVTAHARGSYAEAHFDDDKDGIRDAMVAALEPHLQARVVEAQLHRWKFSIPKTLHPDRFLSVDTRLPLYFAGDIFGGPKLEGAALSGLAVAQHIVRLN